MNYEEFKKYTNKMYENIENKLERDSEEFEFFFLVAESLNKIREENKTLQNALDEIEKYIKNNIKECNGALSNPECALISKHELLQNEKQRNENLLQIIKKVKRE